MRSCSVKSGLFKRFIKPSIAFKGVLTSLLIFSKNASFSRLFSSDFSRIICRSLVRLRISLSLSLSSSANMFPWSVSSCDWCISFAFKSAISSNLICSFSWTDLFSDAYSEIVLLNFCLFNKIERIRKPMATIAIIGWLVID